mmetsp:Transcript_16508/g.24959  ORF Transcript_16508/g.24959 Transcript_16508/m.24959 type:complete len:148 (+) Transcript_16508:1071-1514(+)
MMLSFDHLVPINARTCNHTALTGHPTGNVRITRVTCTNTAKNRAENAAILLYLPLSSNTTNTKERPVEPIRMDPTSKVKTLSSMFTPRKSSASKNARTTLSAKPLSGVLITTAVVTFGTANQWSLRRCSASTVMSRSDPLINLRHIS